MRAWGELGDAQLLDQPHHITASGGLSLQVVDRSHPLAVGDDVARQSLEALRRGAQVSLYIAQPRDAGRREHPGVHESAELAGDVQSRGAEDSTRRERVEPIADGSRPLEDLTERNQHVERREPEVAADPSRSALAIVTLLDTRSPPFAE